MKKNKGLIIYLVIVGLILFGCQKMADQTAEEKKYLEREDVHQVNYLELGEFGRKLDYEGKEEIFYYIPSGTYKVTRMSGTDKICFLWLFYKESYQGELGTEYNTKEKFSFTSESKVKDITITDDVIVYNSNKCNYAFEEQ